MFMFGKKRPHTIFDDKVKVKRKSKGNMFFGIALVIFIIAGLYAFFTLRYKSQFQELKATVEIADAGVRLMDSNEKKMKGSEVGANQIIRIPDGNDRVILIIGKDLTIRTISGARFKFNQIRRNKRTNKIEVNLELQLGRIWVQTGKSDTKIIVQSGVGSIKPLTESDVELNVTRNGTLQVLCWKGSALGLPASATEEFDLIAGQQTALNVSGTMAQPYEIAQKDMNVWEAWNLNTKLSHVLHGNPPSFKEAFLAERKRLKIKGGFKGKIEPGPRTIISGGEEKQAWREGGVSSDGTIVLSYNEVKVERTDDNDLSIKMVVRNDGIRPSKGITVQVKAVDKNNQVVGSASAPLPDLPSMEQKEINPMVESVPEAVNYSVNFIFPEVSSDDTVDWIEGGRNAAGTALISYRMLKKELKGDTMIVELEIRNEGTDKASKIELFAKLMDKDGYLIRESQTSKTVKNLASKEKTKTTLKIKGASKGVKPQIEINVE